jgi:NADH:ubiquinone oxidoreductase subunit 4 (subunit M)
MVAPARASKNGRVGAQSAREGDMEVRGHGRRDAGGIVFGVILLLVGGYYLLQQTFGLNLPDLNWDQIWPVLVIVLGLVVLYGAWSRSKQA